MALLDLWRTSQTQLENKRVHQILAVAGSGRLQDGSDTSLEFRAFLSHIPSRVVIRYADQCLSEKQKFDQGGLALQDVINEIGRRLGFHVEDGRYKGTQGQSGHDGLWSSDVGSLVVEVKTTDAYRINLDTLAGYRRQLIQSGRIADDASSILIVVGRQDTGDLEAQIRGSRYGWNIRLISVDALVRLARLKETVDDPAILRKISGILAPQEFTKVDGIIDLVFATAEDVKPEADTPAGGPDVGANGNQGGAAASPSAFYDACIATAARHLGTPLLRESRTFYMSPNKTIGVLCLLSKTHASRSAPRYWFGLHPKHKELLDNVGQGSIVLGCGAPYRMLVIPWRDFEPWIAGMGKTESEERFYWHISIDGTKLELQRRKGQPKISLRKYLIEDSSKAESSKPPKK